MHATIRARQQWRRFPRKTRNPLGVGTDIRPAKARFRHTGDDRFGEGHPLRKIFVEIPVRRAQPVVGVAVKLRFIANLKTKQPFAQLPGDIGRLFSGPFRRTRAEIQAVNRLPTRRLQKFRQPVNRHRFNRRERMRHPVVGTMSGSWQLRRLVCG